MKRFLLVVLTAALLAGCEGGDPDEFFGFNGGGGGDPQPVAPVANPDNFNGLRNAPINVAAPGVLANDTPQPTVRAVPIANGASAAGGTVTLNADGSFVYTPPANLVGGADTFTYVATNAGLQSAPATVTITIVGNGVFVNNANTNPQTLPNGAGTFEDPFNTLAAAVAGSAPGDTIFVFRGDGTNTGYDTQVNLQDGQSLIGEASGLVLRGEVLAQTVVPPGLFPVITGPVVMADDNTVSGLRIEDSPATGILADDSVNGTITNNQIINSFDNAVQAFPPVGNWTITGNTIDQSGFAGINFVTMGTAVTRAVVAENVITNCAGDALAIGAGGDSELTAQVRDNIMADCLPDFTYESLVGGTATMCLDMFSNTNDDVYRFNRGANAPDSTFNIEQFSQLEQLQNSGEVVISLGSLEIEDVPDTFCQF